MATTLKKGVEATSELVFEEPINVEDDWSDEYGHSKEDGYVYQIVDFTDLVRSVRPTLLNDLRRNKWNLLAESKYVPGFWLVRIPEEIHAQIRAQAEGVALAQGGKKLGFKSDHADAQMSSAQSETKVGTDQIVKSLSPT